MEKLTESLHISQLDDKSVFLILADGSSSGQSYLLYAAPLPTNDYHVALVPVSDRGRRYLLYSYELWSSRIYASNLMTLLRDIIAYIKDTNIYINNPSQLVYEYGGMLHGNNVRLPAGTYNFRETVH